MINNTLAYLQNYRTTSYLQNNYKICIVCNKNNILNEDLMILSCEHNGFNYKSGDFGMDLFLRCSEGHLLKYRGASKYIDSVIKYIEDIKHEKKVGEITLLKNEIKTLKKIEKLENEKKDEEITLLKNEIKTLKKTIEKLENEILKNNTIPSAPVEIVEATMIK